LREGKGMKGKGEEVKRKRRGEENSLL